MGHGERLRDKFGILLRFVIYAFFPIGAAARRIGRPLPDPTRLLGEVTVRGTPGRFVCPPGPSPFFLGIDRSYEPGLCDLLGHLSEGTFVDVGANVGFIAVRAARSLGEEGRVVAIEPHPVRFEYLLRNVRGNELDNVTCVRCAVGAHSGDVTLYDVDPTLGPRHLDASTQPGRGLRFATILRSLDDVIDEHAVAADISLIKIDVEGYELEVLRGMSRVLAHRPRLVIEAMDAGRLADVQALLPIGYMMRRIDPHSYLAEHPDVRS